MANKVAVITGSNSGIGLLTAVELARRQYRVVALMRNLAKRGLLDNAAEQAGVLARVEARLLDVTDTASIAPAVDAIVKDYGRIDTLVNNAGFAMAGFAEDLRLSELREQFETNFFGHVEMTKAVIPVMREQRSGHIIMVSSMSGRTGAPVLSSYVASKFAMEGWSESLRLETFSLGIRVVLVEPGSFKTDIWSKNAKVGEFAMDKRSPNHERGARFTKFLKAHPATRDPAVVARLIADIADNPHPRLRYLIGKDAFASIWLRRVLPWNIYEKLVAKITQID